MIQGQNKYSTKDKERGFHSVFTQQLKMVYGINIRKHKGALKYFHFDCHAGCGWNKDVGVIGSPLLFQQIANESAQKTVMHAIDKDEKAAKYLAQSLEHDPNAFVHIGDNSELVDIIPDIIAMNSGNPRHAYGSVLLDPNNQRAEDIPWKQLWRLGNICRYLDIVFNYPATAMKRIDKTSSDFVHLEELPKQLNKTNLFIRNPLGRWHFTLIVARNWSPRSGHKSLGLFPWDSFGGRRAREKAGLSAKERRDNGLSQLEIGFGNI